MFNKIIPKGIIPNSIMKSDAEIKQWIDSKEAITKKELSIFIYGYWKNSLRLVKKWWDYILENKDWRKQREYKEKRIKNGSLKFPQVPEILKTDKRFFNIGVKKTVKLLKQIYNIEIGNTTIRQIKLKL